VPGEKKHAVTRKEKQGKESKTRRKNRKAINRQHSRKN
jgi:hypothetical protein